MTANPNDRASLADPVTGLRFQVAVYDGVGEVQAIGELDLVSAPVFAPALEVLAAAGAAITVDLSRLTFCDSQGINLFFRIARAARESGGSLTLANPAPTLLRLFEVVDLDTYIRVTADPPPHAPA